MGDCLRGSESRGAGYGGQPAFLILERDALVATDLSQTLLRTGPCRIVSAHSPNDACAALADIPTLNAAFLEMDCATFLGSPLDRALRVRGAMPIFTRGENDDAAIRVRGWRKLRRPFTEEMVLDTLSMVWKQR